MVMATELVDWRRVASPRQLMAYLLFVPREHSGGMVQRYAVPSTWRHAAPSSVTADGRDRARRNADQCRGGSHGFLGLRYLTTA